MEALGYNLNAVSTLTGAIGIDPIWCNGKLLICDVPDWNIFAELIIKATSIKSDIPPVYFEHFYWGHSIHKAAALLTIHKNSPSAMVIGSGLVAKTFLNYETFDEFVIFASGVSNSKTSTPSDFQREYNLLTSVLPQYPTRKIVYFSTCSIDDVDLQETEYVRHKINMEDLIKSNADRYTIFRLSNLAGTSNNQNTILNFLYLHITKSKTFELWKNSERNIIDVEDVYRTVDHILKNNLFLNQVINIANVKNYPVVYMIKCIEDFTNKKAVFSEKEMGHSFNIDITNVRPIYKLLKIEFTKNYLPYLLEKYYLEK